MRKLLIVLLFPLTAFADNTLLWDAANGAANYSVQRCPSATCEDTCGWADIATVVGTVTTYVDTGLPDEYAVCYRVAAVNANGELSGYSNTAGKSAADPANLRVQ